MNKHQIIRTLSVLFFISFVVTISNLDIGVINSGRFDNNFLHKKTWHPDMMCELVIQESLSESGITIDTKMAYEHEFIENLSVSIANRKDLTIKPVQDDVIFINKTLLFNRSFN